MKTLIYRTIFLLFMAVSVSGIAYAQSQEVGVRTGTHNEYSRLVFDWTSKPDYEVSKQGEDTLVISFKNAAKLNMTKADITDTANILKLDVIGEDPAQVKVTIPAASRHRTFYAGSKLVLDVYNPPGGAQKKTVEAKPPETKPAETPKEEPTEEQPEEITETTQAPPPQAELEQAEGADENVEQREAAEVAEVESMPLEDEKPSAESENGPTGSNLINLSSADTIGLAVFERGDHLWLVNDKKDLLVSPQVNGPDTERIVPIDIMNFENGKAFLANRLARSKIRTQGGGLLWKVIISPDDKPTAQQPKAILPIRKDAQEMHDGKATQTRSGKIIWPFKEPSAIIDIKDPVTGSIVKVVTVKNSKDFSGKTYSFVDFDILPSYAGLVIAPKVDDLSVTITEEGVEISRPDGLAILSDSIIEENKPKRPRTGSAKNKTRIYDMKNWKIGNVNAAGENHAIILAGLNKLPQTARDEGYMTLAKMYISNGMGAEALGFLTLLEDNNPDISKTPEFRAIRGAARALDYKTLEAFSDLSTKSLDEFEEIGFWKAFALADLGDWQQAIEVMPTYGDMLYTYPELVLNRIGPVVAEIALRAGNTKFADEVLAVIEEHPDQLNDPQRAAIEYLKGESARQKGDLETTKALWEPLMTGADDLYRAKAGLAYTRLQVDQEQMPPADAIDNLERLRYAWRGDELEGQINYWLGRTYIEAKEFVKGLTIMREAAGYIPGTNLGRRITNEMSDVFIGLYLGDELDDVTPLDAVALYEQFSELIPSGEKGDKIVERLADRLAKADLLPRAGNLLEYQLTHRLKGADAYNVGIKLAAIRLLDNKPDEAMKALNKAAEILQTLPKDIQTPDKFQAVSLLRARGMSRQGRPDQAIALLEGLEPNPVINRLRADIAWSAGYWDDAAAALEEVVLDQNISLTRPLSDQHSQLLLQRAVALNLSNDRIGLANMREKYGDSMAQTEKSRIFDIITRPRQSATLADRETLLGIVSEVDLFTDFLESYKAAAEPIN